MITVGSSSESRFSDAQCVVAGLPGQQPGGGVDEAAGAHRGHQRDGGALGADPAQVVGVAKEPPGAVAARVDEHVQGGRVVSEWWAPRTRPLAPMTSAAVGGQAGDAPAVLGVLLGPVGEDLPGADRVELLDAVEEQQPDVAAACGGLGLEVVCLVGWSGIGCLLGGGRAAAASASPVCGRASPRSKRRVRPASRRSSRQYGRTRAGRP